jgi:hypothetical protein
MKGGVSSGKSLRSRWGTARQRWWPESVGPRAQAGGLIGCVCSGLLTAVEFNPRAHGASRGARKLPVEGIEERLTVELGLRTPVVGWSPATSIRCLRWGRARFFALEASPRHVEAIPRVGRGGEWLGWLVYGGRFSGGRWHAVRRAITGDLALRWGWERAGVYGRGLGCLYRRGRGHEFGLARRDVRGAERRGVL